MAASEVPAVTPAGVGTYLHTLRYLKPSQVAWRLRRIVFPLRSLPAATHPHQILRRAAVPATWRPGGVDDAGFRFLNRTLPFIGDRRWEPDGADRLWAYHLHYFQYLSGMSPERALTLILDWIDTHRDPGGTGWEPYPLTMRIREWIEWLMAHQGLDATIESRIVSSLVEQTMALDLQVEHHLMGNHLLENGVTLAWAAMSLQGSERERWAARSAALLRRELSRQILADGSHDERSPMYQALLADALARLARVAASSAMPEGPELRGLAEPASDRLVRSLRSLAHPDGDYALLNDCALAMAPAVGELARRWLPAEVGPPLDAAWALTAAGYLGTRDADGTYLVFDAGAIGPDHQPGHGHADTLSFELSHRGRRLITDTGVHTYTPGTVRTLDRSTRAHNTIEIDGRDQSELWAAFRCGRRAQIETAELRRREDRVELSGAYRGPGAGGRTVRHQRTLEVQTNRLKVTDRVRCAGSHRAISRLHLAPDLEVQRCDDGWAIHDGRERAATLRCRQPEWCESDSPYHPEFGVEVWRRCLTASFELRDETIVEWELQLH